MMSCFEESNDQVFDMTIEILKETIEDQAMEINKLKEKLKKLRSDNKVKTKAILQRNSEEIEKISIENERIIQEIKSSAELKVDEMTSQSVDLTDRLAVQALLIDSLELDKSLLLKSTDELNKTIVHLKAELQRREDFKAKKLSESIETLKSENYHLANELNEKSSQLEHALKDLEDSYKMLEELEQTSEQNETEFLQTISEVENKFQSMFDDVSSMEEDMRVQKEIAELKDEVICSWEVKCRRLQDLNSQFIKQVNHIEKENQELFSLLRETKESFAEFRVKSDNEKRLQAVTIRSNEQLMTVKDDIIVKQRNDLSSKELEILQLQDELNELLIS